MNEERQAALSQRTVAVGRRLGTLSRNLVGTFQPAAGVKAAAEEAAACVKELEELSLELRTETLSDSRPGFVNVKG